jgi:hypothetical protein
VRLALERFELRPGLILVDSELDPLAILPPDEMGAPARTATRPRQFQSPEFTRSNNLD